MKVLFWGTAIFLISIILHLAIWRISAPKRKLKILLRIFFTTLPAALLSLYIASLVNIKFAAIAPVGIPQYIHICLLFSALALAYTITYSAIEADSPSITIIAAIVRSGDRGVPKEELERLFTDDILVRPRIADLLNDKMILSSGGRYRITAKGAVFVRPFIMYRNLLGLPKGG